MVAMTPFSGHTWVERCLPWRRLFRGIKNHPRADCGVQSTEASLGVADTCRLLHRVSLPSQGQLLNIFLIPDLCSSGSVKEKSLSCSWAGGDWKSKNSQRPLRQRLHVRSPCPAGLLSVLPSPASLSFVAAEGTH